MNKAKKKKNPAFVEFTLLRDFMTGSTMIKPNTAFVLLKSRDLATSEYFFLGVLVKEHCVD